VRCDVGRRGEEELLRRDDADLTALAAAELADATGAVGGPVESRVIRYDGAQPQYGVGHRDKVARIRTTLAGQPGLAVCGAAYDGVGAGLCMGSARKAADRIFSWLGKNAPALASR
jgi:oxygen-dependent protoporphyrinogen oxidase